MEYQLVTEKCSVGEMILDSTKEQPVDLELVLPDYCPDIEQILKCRIIPSVSSKSLSGDTLEVSGSTLVSLYYLDAKKRSVRLCEHTVPFETSFRLPREAEGAAAMVQTKTEYLNCRAVSPRKAELHGAFSIMAQVMASADHEVCCRIEGDDVQQQSHTEKFSRLCGASQQQFSVTEVLDVGQGKSAPETILRSNLSVRLQSRKPLEDKLMLTGEAVLQLLYVSDPESGVPDTMTFHVPFTQVLDAPGVSESTVNDVLLDVMSYDVTLKSEYDENSTLITLDARLGAVVLAYEEAEVTAVDDAYSTAYELELSHRVCTLPLLVSAPETAFAAKSEADTGDHIVARIIDLWCDGISSAAAFEENGLVVKGRLLCCFLALDTEDVPFYMEKQVGFEASVPLPEGLAEPTAMVRLEPEHMAFRITGDNRVELRVDMTLNGTVFDRKNRRMVESAAADEEHPRLRDKTAALTLYYAAPEEPLWEIARRYCTSAEAIRSENELTESAAPGGMLLIPMT